MTQIDTQTRHTPRFGLAPIIALVRDWHHARRDAAVIAALPKDRLQDVGLAPQSRDNARHSGAWGTVPKADMW